LHHAAQRRLIKEAFMSDTTLTQSDNSVPAADRFVPQVLRQLSLAANNNTVTKQLKHDVKSAVVVADHASTCWVSYYDGTNDRLDSQTATTPTEANALADDRVFTLSANEPFTIAQEREFNRVHFKSSGSHTLKIYPGNGAPNGLT
jgi:succinylarginine dihydrolase